MTRATRVDTKKTVGCFPHETLADALAKLIDDEADGTPSGIKFIGKMTLPGDLQRPVEKFAGREVEVGARGTCNACFYATSQVTTTKGEATHSIRVKITVA